MCDGRLFLIFLLKKRLSSVAGLNVNLSVSKRVVNEPMFSAAKV